MQPSVLQWNGGFGREVAVSQITLVAEITSNSSPKRQCDRRFCGLLVVLPPGSVKLCMQSRPSLAVEWALRLYLLRGTLKSSTDPNTFVLCNHIPELD